MKPSITAAQVSTALSGFITAITGIPAVLGQVNRVPSLLGDYAVMWPLLRPRISTNVDSSNDAKFTGSIAGTVLTITEVFTGTLGIGSTIFGVDVVANTQIVAPSGTGTGGVGTYNINNSQTLDSETISAGTTIVVQSTEIVMQVDVHGPNSGDNVQIISTLFRDPYAVQWFSNNSNGVVPLYAENPRQVPFITAAKEYEFRWMVDVHMEIDPSIAVPQQYGDKIVVGVISVEEAYPPE